jgi:hypothetical protein
MFCKEHSSTTCLSIAPLIICFTFAPCLHTKKEQKVLVLILNKTTQGGTIIPFMLFVILRPTLMYSDSNTLVSPTDRLIHKTY